MNCFRFANIMNNTTIINDNSNISNIKTQHQFFHALNQFFHNTFIRPLYQNQNADVHQFHQDFHQDKLSFVCL